jgi:hypothetical protein
MWTVECSVMKQNPLLGCALLALVAVMAAGCSLTPVVDARMGRAVASAVRTETMDPAAATNRTPVTGLESGASVALVARYMRSFAAPPPPANVFSIGVGTGSSTVVTAP